MYKVMRHPHGQTLKQIEAFASSTWDNGLFPLEECLIRVEKCVLICFAIKDFPP